MGALQRSESRQFRPARERREQFECRHSSVGQPRPLDAVRSTSLFLIWGDLVKPHVDIMWLVTSTARYALVWSCSAVSAPYNHALALFQSRLTLTGVIPRTSAVSSTLNPPK